MAEANKARYESDRANMQAIFTNTVAKVMAKNQGVVEIKRSQINNKTYGAKTAIGEIEYTVINAANKENSSGKIVFGKGPNTDTTFYTGKELPIYAVGETKWYVDEEGIISLEVAQTLYGTGKQPLAAGLYDENDVMIASWDELINDYGIDVESDYGTEEDVYNYLENGTLPEKIQSGNYPGLILQMNSDLASRTKLVIGNVEKIGIAAFIGNATLKEVEINKGVSNIEIAALGMCSKLENVNIPNTVTNLGMLAFGQCTSLKSMNIPDLVTSIDYGTFNECSSLTSVTIGNSVASIGKAAFYRCKNLTLVYFKQTNVPTLGNHCFYNDESGSKTCTFYFKNKDVYDAFTTEHYNNSYGIKSDNFNW